MTATGTGFETGRPIVSLGELQSAWEAVQTGRFRSIALSDSTGEHTAGAVQLREWLAAEMVIPVIGAGGGVGASTLALALATASTVPARVIECCSASASGLAAATIAELGATETGWRRGLRDGVHQRILLERAVHPMATAAAVPLPTDPHRPVAVTFLDCGWALDNLLAGGWLGELVTAAPSVVLAARATVPGMRRLEVALDALKNDRVYVGVLGPRRRKWGSPVEASLGPATRALDNSGGLVELPLDRRLSVHGATAAPLPRSLIGAATQLLDLVLPAALAPAPAPVLPHSADPGLWSTSTRTADPTHPRQEAVHVPSHRQRDRARRQGVPRCTPRSGAAH